MKVRMVAEREEKKVKECNAWYGKGKRVRKKGEGRMTRGEEGEGE